VGGWFGGKSGKHNIAKHNEHNEHKQYLSTAKNTLYYTINSAKKDLKDKGLPSKQLSVGTFISAPENPKILPSTNMQIQARLQPMGDHFQKTATINNVVKEWQTLQNKAKAEEVDAARLEKAENERRAWKKYLNNGGQ